MRTMIAVSLLCLSASVSAAEHFLEADEIARLEPAPNVPGTSRYITPGVNPAAFDRLLVGSVTFYFDEDSKAKDMDADESKQISDAMKAALASAAAGNAQVVSEPGPSTALVNVAITEINMQNKKRGLLGYTPVGLVVTTAANLSGMRMQLKDARIEGEFVDSVSGERIAVFRVDQIGDWDDKKGLSWEDLRAGLESAVGKAIAATRQ
ncbi:MAG: DUF3313 family protein [Pseudomonadales bacterium]|nr:DUF3313 family protein [Pseudomonadales bacterium]